MLRLLILFPIINSLLVARLNKMNITSLNDVILKYLTAIFSAKINLLPIQNMVNKNTNITSDKIDNKKDISLDSSSVKNTSISNTVVINTQLLQEMI